MPLRLNVAKAIAIGGRDYQEDSCEIFQVENTLRVCAIVADGMGGHQAGDKASAIAVESCADMATTDLASATPAAYAQAVVALAHKRVTEFNQQHKLDARTTIVVAVFDGPHVDIINVGDSRAYHISATGVVRVTRDDSIPEMLLAMGEITEEEMATHPDQGRLTKSVGGSKEPTPKLRHATLSPGEALLLCSDGFWEMVRPSELGSLLACANLQVELDNLTALAAKRGGVDGDNISACALRLETG